MLPLHHVHILGLVTGLEPATHRLQGDRSAIEPHQQIGEGEREKEKGERGDSWKSG